jgi:hypothetical protein
MGEEGREYRWLEGKENRGRNRKGRGIDQKRKGG